MVLADEPTANLDTANGEQAMEIMQRLNQQLGTAFVFATHDPRVMSFARRVVKMRDGRIVDDGVQAAIDLDGQRGTPAAMPQGTQTAVPLGASH